MMAPRIAGLICCQSPSLLVTEMKSEPKNTPHTFGRSNNFSASGDCAAASLVGMSSVPLSSTPRPGRNFRVAGLGVDSVWMNIVWLLAQLVQGPWMGGLYQIDGPCAGRGQPAENLMPSPQDHRRSTVREHWRRESETWRRSWPDW